MPLAVIFTASLAFPKPSTLSLSSCRAFTGPNPFLSFSTVSSSLTASTDLNLLTSIRMGGGPRTFPGGVSKWQWKRMQAKKSKQLLKARLCRERQLYEMRKRAELKAAISELERPWEVVERAPVLFSSSADEQVKALADRFKRPSGFDMWTERDGPRLFRSPDDLPSARFIPKSVQPYGVVSGEVDDGAERRVKAMKYHGLTSPDSRSLESERSVHVEGENRGSYCSDSELVVTGSTKAENKIAGHFDRHGQNRGSHGSDSGLAVDGSRMNGKDMERDFGSRGYRSQSSQSSDSRMERRDMARKFGRRGGHRNSHGNHMQFAVNGARIERDKISSDRNQGSYESHSEKTITGSRMHRHETASRFDRGRGRGGRGRGGRGGNRGSYRSYSDLTVTDSKMEGEEIAGGFEKPIGRGVNRNSNYGSDSEIAISDSRKGRVEKTGFRFRGRDYRNGGRVSLRPTTELALREGDDMRREKKRSEGRNGGFIVSRGRRKP